MFALRTNSIYRTFSYVSIEQRHLLTTTNTYRLKLGMTINSTPNYTLTDVFLSGARLPSISVIATGLLDLQGLASLTLSKKRCISFGYMREWMVDRSYGYRPTHVPIE